MKRPTLELKVPPVAVWLVAGLLMAAADAGLPELRLEIPMRAGFQYGLLLVALACIFPALVSFRRRRTTVHPQRPDVTQVLVTTGVFAYSRNPMYLGLALALFAYAFRLSNPIAFIFPFLFVAYMNTFQIAAEERILMAKFGSGIRPTPHRLRDG